ncbi:MAG: hypothetical protein QM493_11500 [Sulfurovum sp.]
MRLIISFLLLFAISYSKNINNKFVVSADKNIIKIKKELLRLENYFRDSEPHSMAEEKYNLRFTIEKIGEFYIVTLKPIITIEIQNELFFLLNPIARDIFVIEDKIVDKIEFIDDIIENISDEFDEFDDKFDEEIEMTHEVDEEIEIEEAIKKRKAPYTVEQKSLIESIGLEWIAIFLLAFIGLFSSIYNRRKLLRIEKKQRNLISHQDKVDNEITRLGR